MLPENEYSEIESRYYLNPQVGLDESNKFIENLRSTQQQNTAQIAKDTAALGTDVSSNLGGLGGGTDYWTARLSTPQTSSAVANLRATAQAAALNQALQNEQEMWKKRYNDAYRAYQKRQNDASKANQNLSDQYEGDLDYEDTGATTGLDAVQDVNQYDTKSTIYDSTQQSLDNRSTERNRQVEVTKDSSGNVSVLTINGVPHYGRDARARYRYLKNAGLVR